MSRCLYLTIVAASLTLLPLAANGAGLSGPRGDLIVDDFGYSEYRSGDKRWTVSAKKSSHDFDANIAQIDNLRLQLFTVAVPTQVLLLADSGVLRFTERLVELRGDIKADDPRGYSFSTETLVYDDRTQVAQGQGQIIVEADGLQISGYGFDYTTSTGIFRIHHGVEALIDVPRK